MGRGGLLAALLACGCHYALPAGLSEEEQPLWTEADLPELPPDADNGWVVFGENKENLSLANPMSGNLRALVQPDDARFAELTWEDALDSQESILSFLVLKKNDHAAWASMLLDSLARPRFADACRISWETRCPGIELMLASHNAALEAILEAQEGFWKLAAGSASSMVRGGFDLAVSSRGLVNRIIAVSMSGTSLSLAATLLAGWEAEGDARRGDPEDRAALADLCAAVEAFDPRDIDPWQPMIGEYLGMVDLLDKTALRSDDGEIVDMFMYDRDATLYTLNRWFEELERFARAPFFLDRPDFPRPTEQNGWWLYNPIGKQLIGALGTYYGNRLRDLETHRRDLAATRDDVLGRCEALGLLAPVLTAESLEP